MKRMKWVDWRTFLGCPNEPTPPEDAFEGDPWFSIEEAHTSGFPHKFAAFVTENQTLHARGLAAAFEVGPVCGHFDHLNCREGGL